MTHDSARQAGTFPASTRDPVSLIAAELVRAFPDGLEGELDRTQAQLLAERIHAIALAGIRRS